MKIFYLILVLFIIGCSSTKKPVQERTILGTYIEIHPDGSSVVKNRYSDSIVTVVSLNKAGELIDSSSHKSK